MDKATNTALLNVVEVLTEVAVQVNALPLTGVDMHHVFKMLGEVRRELNKMDLTD